MSDVIRKLHLIAVKHILARITYTSRLAVWKLTAVAQKIEKCINIGRCTDLYFRFLQTIL